MQALLGQPHAALVHHCWQALEGGECEGSEARGWLLALTQLLRLHPTSLSLERCLEVASLYLQSSDVSLVKAAVRVVCDSLAASVAAAAVAAAAPSPSEEPLAIGAAGGRAGEAPGGVQVPPETSGARDSEAEGGDGGGGGVSAKRSREEGQPEQQQERHQQPQQQQQHEGLRAWQWRAAYEGVLGYATRHAHPAVRAAAMEGVCEALKALPLSPDHPSPIHRTPDNVLPAYRAAALEGLRDNSGQVQLAACRLASRTAAMAGAAPMSLPAAAVFGKGKAAQRKAQQHQQQVQHGSGADGGGGASQQGQQQGAQGGGAGGGAGSAVPMLQFGEALSVADHAFQRVCGLLVEPSAELRVQAVEGLAGLAGASSRRVKLQAFSKKATLVVAAAAGGEAGAEPGRGEGGQGPGRQGQAAGIEVEGSLLDESLGAFVHAAEDEHHGVREALARTLARLACADLTVSSAPAAVADLEVAQQAADYLVDLMHDEVDSVRLAAASALAELAHAQRQQQLLWAAAARHRAPGKQQQQQQQQQRCLLDLDHLAGVAGCLGDPSPAVRGLARQILLQSVEAEPAGLEVLVQALVSCWRGQPLERPACQACARSAGRAQPSASAKLAASQLQLQQQQQQQQHAPGVSGAPAASRQGPEPKAAGAVQAERGVALALLGGALSARPELRPEGLPAQDMAEAMAQSAPQQLQGQGQGQQTDPPSALPATVDLVSRQQAATPPPPGVPRDGKQAAAMAGDQPAGQAGQGAAGEGGAAAAGAASVARQGYTPGLPLLLRPFLTYAGEAPPDLWLKVALTPSSAPCGVVREAGDGAVALLLRVEPSAWYPLEDGGSAAGEAAVGPPSDAAAVRADGGMDVSVRPRGGSLQSAGPSPLAPSARGWPQPGSACSKWGAAPDLELDLEQGSGGGAGWSAGRASPAPTGPRLLWSGSCGLVRLGDGDGRDMLGSSMGLGEREEAVSLEVRFELVPRPH